MESQSRIIAWIAEEMEFAEMKFHAKSELEILKKKKDQLNKKLENIAQRPYPEVIEHHRRFDMEEVELEIRGLPEQIMNSKELITYADRRGELKEILDRITGLPEAKTVIIYLYNRCIAGNLDNIKRERIYEDRLEKQRDIYERKLILQRAKTKKAVKN
ncbi:hypothetical protein JTE90_004802 [Oedothorax gibbosus]|uniref:Uncharacterized protein n=1 Tax=Oedothorax gibbosus TaxID=931172 RepID=A0AAV6VJD5_9ARAC|nr:hypothetical protein JTE90_004802 [Oedothorax gibbosus]